MTLLCDCYGVCIVYNPDDVVERLLHPTCMCLAIQYMPADPCQG